MKGFFPFECPESSEKLYLFYLQILSVAIYRLTSREDAVKEGSVMPYELKSIIPMGRAFADYRDMFDLDSID
jgi:hypothetical protein